MVEKKKDSTKVEGQSQKDVKPKNDESLGAEEVSGGKEGSDKGAEVKDAELRLNKMEMMELELHENRARMQVEIREKFVLREHLQQVEYLAQRDAIRNKQKEAAASLEMAKRAYNDTVERINRRLGVSLGDWAIKDDGTLRYIKDAAYKTYEENQEKVSAKEEPAKT